MSGSPPEVPETPDPGQLAEGVRSGDRRALARAITLAESSRTDHRTLSLELLEEVLPDTGGALRLGISGPPGVGKSTLIEALGLLTIQHGRSPAVLTVDPSSRRSGGSVLGDKTRMMELAKRPEAFIRPSPGGRELGGVARRTREAILLCEAAGFDLVVVETIGVGQSEQTVAEMTDAFVLLVAPGGGDELQGVKRGIMELADVVVVTKADGDLAPAAARSVADHRAALGLLRPRWSGWQPPVLACSATTGTGLEEVWSTIVELDERQRSTGRRQEQRRDQSVAWMWSDVEHAVLERFRAQPPVQALAERLETDVRTGSLSPPAAAEQLLEADAQGGDAR